MFENVREALPHWFANVGRDTVFPKVVQGLLTGPFAREVIRRLRVVCNRCGRRLQVVPWQKPREVSAEVPRKGPSLRVGVALQQALVEQTGHIELHNTAEELKPHLECCPLPCRGVRTGRKESPCANASAGLALHVPWWTDRICVCIDNFYDSGGEHGARPQLMPAVLPACPLTRVLPEASFSSVL